MNNNTYKNGNEKFIKNDEIDLKEVWKSIIRKKKIVILTTSFIFLIGTFNTLKNRIFNPIYSGTFLLLINDPLNSGGDEVAPATLAFYSNLATSSTNNDVPTLVTFLKSPYLLDDISNKYDLTSKSLSNLLDISQVKTSNEFADGVLEVTININNFEKGEDLLKDLSNVYLDSALDQKRQRLKDGIDFLNDQEPIMRKRTQEIQDKLANFRRENLLIEPIADGQTIKDFENELNQKITNLELSINKIKQIRDKVSKGLLSARSFKDTVLFDGGGLEISSEDSISLDQLILLEKEIEIARSKFTEESNYIKSLRSRLNTVKPRLIESQLSSLDNAIYLKEIDLKESEYQKNKILNLLTKNPELINIYNTLQEELEIASENLVGLISAKESFQLEIAQSSVPWKIISPPTMNPIPVKPSIPKGIGYSGIFAIIVGSTIGLIRDRLDHVFHEPNEVKEALNKPILGNIPFVSFMQGSREKQSKIIDLFENQNEIKKIDKKKNYERFIWQESMRNISTSLRFLNTDLQVKSIAITSSSPAEGKSSAVILLAKALSDLDLKVLLIDSDLRKPQLHYRLGLNNLQGLSNLLTNKNLKFNDLIQPVDGEGKWFVLTAGQKVPDPTRLFSSKRMSDLTSQISADDTFDYIIYDTPPSVGFADPAIISSKLDGYILLVSIFNVDRDLPKIVIKKMDSLGASNLGIITNNQIKSELIQSTKDFAYKDYADYYSNNVEDLKNAGNYDEELRSNKQIFNSFYKNKIIKKALNKINEFLKWIDR